MKIEKHVVVSMHYNLVNSEGELLDTTKGEEPLSFLIGAEQIPPALENELMGLRVGDKKEVVLTPEQGYGEYDDDLVEELHSSDLDGIDEPQVGEFIEMETEDGDWDAGEIVEINDDSVIIDFNHPLAGETLHYQIEITNLRPATPEEIAHGHVH